MATIFPREEKAEQLFEKILENPDACERLKDTFYEHFPESEDMDAQMPAVSAQTFTRALFQAYQNKDLSAFLMAICGNSMFDLLRNSFLIPIRFDDKGKTNPILLTDDQGILREKLPVNVPDKVYQKFSRIYQHREPIPQMREYLAELLMLRSGLGMVSARSTATARRICRWRAWRSGDIWESCCSMPCRNICRSI